MFEHRPEQAEKAIPSLAEGIEKQAAYFDEHPEDVTPEYLNSMYLWLPDSLHIEYMYKHGNADQLRVGDRFSNYMKSQTVREFVDTVAQTMEEVADQREPLIKKLQEEQEIIQQQIKKLDKQITTTLDEIRPLPEAENKSRFREEAMPLISTRDRYHMQLKGLENPNLTLVPLYRALRAKGYSHYDLVG